MGYSLKRSTTLTKLLQVWEFFTQQRRRRQGLLRGDIAGGSHNQIWLATLIVALPTV
jgi:hypothetical protein